MKPYSFKEVEQKWQDKWFKEKTFKAIDFHPTKPKYYVLYEFFNISGNLHMGHLKGSVPADALARYKRFCGYNVLFPIGGDSFGLPAENAAIKKGTDPAEFVRVGAENAYSQSRKLGLSFDWDRTFCTSDEDYYKWTQWIFLQLLKNDKAYKQKGVVNFCEHCKTVLSNEDSQGGKCDRCHNPVTQVERNVWFLKMREYADKLLANVDRITMAESLKESQRNWIGKSEGMEVTIPLVDAAGKSLSNVKIFTTCIETIYGITFIVLAPEHKIVEELKDKISNYKEVAKYKEQTALRSEFDRISNTKSKSGVKLDGIYAINPVNGNKVSVYLADFVLANYGSGAVMAVPSHDQRDYEFAKEQKLPFIQVIEGDTSKCAVEKYDYIPLNSKMMNSEEFSGLPVREAKQKIAEKVIKLGVGERKINYKMQDWPFNRQRYWGEPFPIVICPKCGIVPMSEKDLPLTLPKVTDYLPNDKGDSPLSKATDWVNCTCPKCKSPARHETDTMPNWAGSSWYWLRFCDPHNDKKLADFDKLKYWGSVDCYTGGTEHITRHVLYAFFWQNFLYEIGAVPTRDPFIRKMGSGLILDSEGKKMSKSSTNGVSPLEVIDKYGSDVARLHLHFLGGYEDNVMWTFDGINGITSFLSKVWNLPDLIKGDTISKEHNYDINLLNSKISENYENLKLNTAISSCMIFMKKVKEDGFITKEELRQFLIFLNPLAPHITSELYEYVFGKDIATENWPKLDKSALTLNTIEIPVQVYGKVKGTVNVSQDATEEEVLNAIKADGELKRFLTTAPKKVVYVKNRIINLIV